VSQQPPEEIVAEHGDYPRLRANSKIEAWLVTIAHRKAPAKQTRSWI
jgi:hypothetical protein